MNAHGQERTTPPLLVRRAAPAMETHIAALLREVALGVAEVAELVRRRTVLVLSDVTLPPDAPPVAAVAFAVDQTSASARLLAIGVAGPARRRGHARRLLNGALTLLRAEGIQRVDACAPVSGPAASLLFAGGFVSQDAAGMRTGAQGRPTAEESLGRARGERLAHFSLLL